MSAGKTNVLDQAVVLQTASAHANKNRRYTDSILLAKVARQDVQLCPVLGNRSPGYWYTAVGKDFHNFFVAQWVPSIFVSDQVKGLGSLLAEVGANS